MTGKLKRTRGRGTLHLIAGLLIASAMVRISAQAGPALAEGATAVSEPEAEVSPVVETDALLAAFQTREARLVTQEAQLWIACKPCV